MGADYADSARLYLDAGWYPLPLLDNDKGEVPAGSPATRLALSSLRTLIVGRVCTGIALSVCG